MLVLTQKNQLTHNVWELIYASEKSLGDVAGQFLLCDCDAEDPRKKRSYSISWAGDNQYEFIIKREEHGTGGSVAICDQKVGHEMKVM